MKLFEKVGRVFSDALRFATRRPRRTAALRARADIGTYVNRIISDAVLFNELPSPTEKEEVRCNFILRRLTEFGYTEVAVDEHGNVSVIVPASGESVQYVLVFADIRCEEYSPAESLARLEKERVVGRGIAENSLGVSGLLVLAEYLIKNQIQLGLNLVLLFTSFDPGAQETQPLEHFLRGWAARLAFGVNVRGLGLGRVEERPMGTYKLVVTARTPERQVLGTEPGASAITVLANVAHRLGSIRWDSQNDTFLNVARIQAGVGFGWYAAEGVMELEIFSANRDALEMTRKAVGATIANLAAEAGASAEITVKTFFPTGNAEMNTGLNRALQGIQARLKIKSLPVSLPDHSAVLNSLGLPAVSVGIATGRKSFREEYVDIRPIEAGFRQLFSFLEESTRERAGGHA